MSAVMIGADPHKSSHTAVAIDEREGQFGQMRVRTSGTQAGRLLTWAKDWPVRTWAIEGAAGLGYLLAQQLAAAGERVVDVQPKLAARARLPDNSDSNKNDPDDAARPLWPPCAPRPRRRWVARNTPR
jgi:transposase